VLIRYAMFRKKTFYKFSDQMLCGSLFSVIGTWRWLVCIPQTWKT